MPSKYRYLRFRILSEVTYSGDKMVHDIYAEQTKGVVRFTISEEPQDKILASDDTLSSFNIIEVEYTSARMYYGVLLENTPKGVVKKTFELGHEPRRPG